MKVLRGHPFRLNSPHCAGASFALRQPTGTSKTFPGANDFTFFIYTVLERGSCQAASERSRALWLAGQQELRPPAGLAPLRISQSVILWHPRTTRGAR